jgi:hypothetical protein
VPTTRSTRAGAQPVDHLFLLRGGAEAAEHLDAHRELAQPAADVAVVLLRQDGGRHQERHLPAIVDRLERRADGHLGLAVAHIAADQAIHRSRRLHVLLDRIHCAQLVVGLLVGEGGLHIFLPRPIRAVDKALDRLALGVELEQVVGDLGDGVLGALLDQAPSPPCPGGSPAACSRPHPRSG